MTYPANDTEFYEEKLTEVRESDDGYTLGTDMGFISAPKAEGVEPKVGDTVRFYGRPYGTVRGIFVNGQKLRYQTADEEQAAHMKQVLDDKAQKKADYEAKKDEYEARIKALPGVFQERVNAFMSRRDDFGPEYLPYELFCLEQAAAFAKAFPTTEQLQEFYKADWDKQREMCPEMSEDHSGNTFGFSVRMASILIDDSEQAKEFAVKFHGALCPLVGCGEYGCYASTDEAKALSAAAAQEGA